MLKALIGKNIYKKKLILKLILIFKIDYNLIFIKNKLK
jgi:hypothetical protein